MVLYQLLCGSIAHPYLTAAEVQDPSIRTPSSMAGRIVMAGQVLWPDSVMTHLSLEFRRLVEGFLRKLRIMRFGLTEVGDIDFSVLFFCSHFRQGEEMRLTEIHAYFDPSTSFRLCRAE